MRDERTSRDTKTSEEKKNTGGEQQHLHHQTKCKLDITKTNWNSSYWNTILPKKHRKTSIAIYAI